MEKPAYPSVRLAGPQLQASVGWICRQAKTMGGRALLVGGAVRDAALGLEAKDADVEIYGLEAEQVEALLRKRFHVSLVGRAFGVFKLSGIPVDVSLPRTESKTGSGHRGFKVTGNPRLAFADAARRRDFSINAMAWDPLDDAWLDPFGGIQDLRKGILRHVSEHFKDDPLRVLRGMQFIARFELEPDPATIALCRGLDKENLPPERQFEEWKKLILQGKSPSRGLTFLKNCGWLTHYPELEALVGCPQDPRWHPEGDVWTHTLHCMDAFARERSGEWYPDLIVGLAVLCHDMGKPATTVQGPDGSVRSPRHDSVGAELAVRFLKRLSDQKSILAQVATLVKTHMRPVDFYKNRAGDAAIRRLAQSVDRLDWLVRVVRADGGGRPPLIADHRAGDWLLERAAALEVEKEKPRPLIQGRDLIARGLSPGAHFKSILNCCFEAQLDGVFKTREEAQAYLRKLLKSRG